ncbi:uncharacterized protein LOC135202719 [Macrobrachium nipponense]|uniref:uncharacterized protein LOC135202719 n=1 Tax=Macrobrachium nipponense TaxID=159736 RepID=UPI0030C829F5
MAPSKMNPVMIGTFILGIISHLTSAQNYTMCYDVHNGTDACMSLHVDMESKLIYFHMNDHDDFEEVNTLEDYNTGFAASRVESQDGCFVRILVTSIEDQVAFIESQQQTTVPVDQGDMNVLAVSLDNPLEEIGETLTNFCGDLPVYKLVKNDGNVEKKEEEEEEEEEEVSKRQVSITFRKCILLLFVAKCFTTTITVPTGLTITYFWFFG